MSMSISEAVCRRCQGLGVPLRSNFQSKKPHFFRIIHPALLRYGTPEIPKRFMRQHGKDLSSVIFLNAPNGVRWRVELMKRQGEPALFQEGWQQFCDFYAIGYGHFLLFRYEGDSHFHVFIFDMTATEIAYPSPPSTNHESETDVSLEILNDFPGRQTDREEEEEDTVVVITSSGDELDTSGNLSVQKFKDSLLSSRRDSDTRKRKSPFHQLETKADLVSSSARKFRHEGKVDAKEISGVGNGPATAVVRLRAESFKSENPFFIKTMRWSYITGVRTMSIPMRFVRRYFKTDNDKATLILSEGRTRSRWSVRYYLRSRDAKFSTDWGKFSGDNCLQIGDVCVFEVIKPSANLLKVAIFRSEDR